MSKLASIRMVRDHREKVLRQIREACAEALNDGAAELLRVANTTVPYREGILSGSGNVEKATPSDLVAKVGYGGAASAYAARQHEETGWRHAPGRRSKWLELAAKEDGPRIMRDVAERARGRLG